MNTTEEPFWELANKAEVEGNPTKALDIVFQTVDDLFREGKAAILDSAILTIDIPKCGTRTLTGLLATTAWGKELLPNRPEFYRLVCIELVGRNEGIPQRMLDRLQ